MTTKQELKAWSKKFSGVKTEVEREEFKKNLHASLSKRDEASLTAGLFAVKEFAREVRLEAEKKAESAAPFQVFPTTNEDGEFLRGLLDRMKIPYKISAE